MRFSLLFILSVFIQVSILQTLISPGFLAPDLLLVILLSRAFFEGREAVLWAILGGALVDIVTDTLGLNLSLEVLSTYIFLLASERFIFRNAPLFLILAGVIPLLKRSLSLLLMRVKFSFDASLEVFIISWFFELALLLAVYFLRRRR